MMSKTAILIHGWSPNRYTTRIKNPYPSFGWDHMPELTSLLSKNFKLKYYNLPGFCGEPEPNKDHFDVEDFTNVFAKWMKKEGHNAKVIIGYSFGGAIALDYKVRSKTHIPIILISPAIIRANTLKSNVAALIKRLFPKVVSGKLRRIYQNITSEYYRKGTPFLKNTYNIIVRRDLRPLLKKINSKEVLLIYGTHDSATPWNLVEKTVVNNKLKYQLFQDGNHNIGQTHPREIVEKIRQFFNSPPSAVS